MRSASRAKRTAAAVVNSETPAMTGTRALGELDGAVEHAALLLRAQRVALAHRAHQYETVDTLLEEGLLHSSRRQPDRLPIAHRIASSLRERRPTKCM